MTPEQQIAFDKIKAERAASSAMTPEQQEAFTQAKKNRDYMMLSDEEKDRASYLETFDEAEPWEQFLAGAGKPVLRIAESLGIGRNLNRPKTDAEKRQSTNMMEAQHGVPAMVGNIAGEVAMLAIPAAKVAQGARTLTSAAPRLGQAATVLGAESALVGGVEAAKMPETGETRLGNAAEAAIMTAVLGAPFAGLQAGKISKEAKEMLESGVELTPGMAGGAITRELEKFMSNIPGLAGKTKRMQDKAIEQWNEVLMNQTRPLQAKTDGSLGVHLAKESPPVPAAGQAGFDHLQKQFKRSYKSVWNDLTPGEVDVDGLLDRLIETSKKQDGLPADSLPAAKKASDNLMDMLGKFERGDIDAGSIETMDDLLRESASGATDHLTGQYYKSLRDALQESIDPLVMENLKKVDASYRKFKVLEKAGSYVRSLEAGSVFDPRQLTSAVRAKNDPRLTTRGEGAMQREAQEASDTIAQVLPGRSEVSPAESLGKWGTLVGVAGTGGSAAVPMVGARVGLLNEPTRRLMTDTLKKPKAARDTERLLRLLGVSAADEYSDSP